MRKELFAVLCMAGILLWGGTTATAVDITWNALMHDSIAGHGPGADKLIGTEDDTTTGESNTCNFVPTDDCGTTGNPQIGSYTYAAIEFDGAVTHECIGGPRSAQSCLCADLETPCTSNGDCPNALCAPGKCCPGLLAACIACAQDDPEGEPFGPPKDGYTYAGPSAEVGAAGTLTTCQEADPEGDEDPPTEFQFKAADWAANGPSPGFGTSCLRLPSTGGPFLGTPCTGSGPISGSLDTEALALDCKLPTGVIADLSVTGDIIDITDPDNPAPSTSSCGYNSDELKVIAGHAVEADANAKHLMIICGDTIMPDTTAIPCAKNAIANLVWVLYTTDDATQCPDDGCQ
jgi:hypothetical protein